MDVHKVASQPGTYLANIFNEKLNQLQTVVTFNKGAHWRSIPAPKGARCPRDEQECTLHLALDSAAAVRVARLLEEKE